MQTFETKVMVLIPTAFESKIKEVNVIRKALGLPGKIIYLRIHPSDRIHLKRTDSTIIFNHKILDLDKTFAQRLQNLYTKDA